MSEFDDVESMKGEGEALDTFDSILKGTEAISSGNLEGPSTGAGVITGTVQAIAGYDELQEGDTEAGILDIGSGEATAAGEAMGLAGAEGAGGVLGAVGGGLQFAKGADEMQMDEGYGGQTLAGISDMISGGLSAAAAFGPWGKAASIGGKLGMAAGNLLAPLVFGSMDEDATVMTEDGQYHASTGNTAVDWVCGVGKYANGRW